MTDREKLEQAIAALEAQRAALGDVAVDAALAGLREKLRDSAPSARPSAGWQGERKLVTVMFADISGFTAMSETMDPEAVRALMNACFEKLVPVIKKYDGTIDKFIGDEIMALFGAPLAHENDPERALRAAIEMFAALEAFNAARGAGLGLHFGINTGLVIAGDIGAQEQQGYSVMGDAVNVAKRLVDVSERGEILVGADTYRHTRPLFDFIELAPVTVKGKSQPLQVYRLLQAKAKPGRVRGLEARGLSSTLVGRERELLTVQIALENLAAGQGGILSIVGEAGLGKSRLLAEARKNAVAQSLNWMEGRALSLGQTISYWPFQVLLRQAAHILEEDSETVAWTKLNLRIMELFPEQCSEILPYLSCILTLKVRGDLEERVKYLDGEAMKRQIFLASHRFFERLASVRPLLLVFEDLHWADASSLELLDHLLPLTHHLPLLICIVTRPDTQPALVALQDTIARECADQHTQVLLQPLSTADSTQLVCNLLEAHDLPAQVRETILRKAEGNPFFVEEVLRALIDLDLITQDAETGRWQVSAAVTEIAIPDTVQGVVAARVDRLDDEVKQVLRMAAVIGRNFLYRVLQAVAEADRKLDAHLTTLQQIEFIREKQRMPELEYMFKHALMQEAAYAGILHARRREMHNQVGACIEALFADRLEEFCGLLAYHYARAENWEKAQAYLFQAGDQAGQIAADAEALTHYQQALNAYTRAFGDRWEPLQRASLERKMGEALFRQGNHDQAFAYLKRALGYLGYAYPDSRNGVRWAVVKELVRQIGHYLRPGAFLNQEALDPDLLDEIYHIYTAMGWINFFTDHEQYLLGTLRGLNLSERAGFTYGSNQAYMGMAMICDILALFRIAHYYHQRSLAMAETNQQPITRGIAYHGIAYHNYCLGNWEDALTHYQEAAEFYWQAGNLRAWGIAATMASRLLGCRGDALMGREHSQKIAQLGEDTGDAQLSGWGWHGVGYAQMLLGLQDEATQHLRQALELYQAVPDYVFIAIAAGDLGQCYLSQGQWQPAIEFLERMEGLVQEHNVKEASVALLRNSLTAAYLMAAEQPGLARAERAAWLKKARRTGRAALKQSQTFHVGLPRALHLRGRYAWLRGKSTIAQRWWQRSLTAAETLGARHDLGMTHLEMGRYLRDRGHLEQARDIFAALGAKWDWAQAQALLE